MSVFRFSKTGKAELQYRSNIDRKSPFSGAIKIICIENKEKVYINKQELKEKILEIINNNYSEDYICDDDGNELQEYYFDIDACTEEIEKLFKEVE